MNAYWIDRLLFVLLGLFLLVYGLQHATNVEIVWMGPVGAICALAAGVVCLLRAFYTGRGTV